MQDFSLLLARFLTSSCFLFCLPSVSPLLKLSNFAQFLGPIALNAATALVKAKTIGGVHTVQDARNHIGKI